SMWRVSARRGDMGLFGKKKRGDDRYGDDGYADDTYADGHAGDYGDEAYDDYDAGYAQDYDDYDEGYDAPVAAEASEQRTGPYDYDDVAELLENVTDQRLDLGSVILPVPPGGQLQVEMTPEGAPQAVHLATEHGRITVAAYAAPKSPGQWRTVAADLAESLRKDG